MRRGVGALGAMILLISNSTVTAVVFLLIITIGSGGGCAGGSVPMGCVPVRSWCREVSLGVNTHTYLPTPTSTYIYTDGWMVNISSLCKEAHLRRADGWEAAECEGVSVPLERESLLVVAVLWLLFTFF